jgi:hypothetical protein
MPPIPLEIQNVELSIDDILSLHRHWITKLYIEERKSEEEIVDALYERRLPVTCVAPLSPSWLHSHILIIYQFIPNPALSPGMELETHFTLGMLLLERLNLNLDHAVVRGRLASHLPRALPSF